MSNQLKSVKLVGTTDASGDATIIATHAILGWLVAVQWIDGDLTDGVDAVLSVVNPPSPGADKTLLTLTNANADAWYHPRVAECDAAGVALANYTLMIIEGTLKLVIASGGSTHTGGCIVYYTDR
jgi:hypothetical protein